MTPTPHTEHRIYLRQNTLSNERINVECTCGELYADLPYETLTGPYGEHYGVPFSEVSDIGERHLRGEFIRR